MTTELGALGALGAKAEELTELATAARSVLAGEWSVDDALGLLSASEPVWSPALWRTVCQLGWADLLVDERSGGSGGDVMSLCAIAEEVGAAAAPLPVSAVAAAAALCGEVTGDRLTIPVDPALGPPSGGAVGMVPFAAVATDLLHLDPQRGIVRIEVTEPGVTVTPVRALDRGPAAAVEIAEGAGTAVVTDDPTATWTRAGTVVVLGRVAELVGVAAAANTAAAAYACERVAFGRPIGTFQAIKHRLVDQRADIEVARALVRRAAGAIDRADPDASALTSLAASWAADRLRRVPEGCTQVFGGIAYTWEHPMHVHVRRAACLTAALGPPRHHRRVVVDWLAAGAHT